MIQREHPRGRTTLLCLLGMALIAAAGVGYYGARTAATHVEWTPDPIYRNPLARQFVPAPELWNDLVYDARFQTANVRWNMLIGLGGAAMLVFAIIIVAAIRGSRPRRAVRADFEDRFDRALEGLERFEDRISNLESILIERSGPSWR